MNYYIQGDAANTDKINAAFEKMGYDTSGHLFNAKSVLYFTFNGEIRATTDKLFQTFIKSRPDYKELELPVKPKFKVGDKIRSKCTQIIYTINEIDVVNCRYKLDYCSVLDFKQQDKFELVPNSKPHYDIASFYAGMPVLVREDNVCRWNYSVFSHITGNKNWQFAVCNGVSFTQCIPFEGNEHLLGAADMCDEQYINW